MADGARMFSDTEDWNFLSATDGPSLDEPNTKHWTADLPAYWPTDLPAHGAAGPSAYWLANMPVHWTAGPSAYWPADLPVHWTAGPSARWTADPLTWDDRDADLAARDTDSSKCSISLGGFQLIESPPHSSALPAEPSASILPPNSGIERRQVDSQAPVAASWMQRDIPVQCIEAVADMCSADFMNTVGNRRQALNQAR